MSSEQGRRGQRRGQNRERGQKRGHREGGRKEDGKRNRGPQPPEMGLRRRGYFLARALRALKAALRSETSTLSLWPSAKVRTKVTRLPMRVTAKADPTM